MTPALRQVLFGARRTTAPTTLNPSDKSGLITLSGGNLTAAKNSGASWASVRTIASASSGKFYCEATNVNAGVAVAAGIGNASATLSNFPGNADAFGVGWPSNDANFYANSGGTGTVGGVSWNAAGHQIKIALDVDHLKVWFANIGGNWNNDVIANQNPATNTGGFSIAGIAPPFFFMASAFSVSAPIDTVTFNLGATAFIDTPPAGFGSLG